MSEAAEKKIENGYIKDVDGKVCIFYEGYWIRYYAAPEDTLSEKKRLIESLTRRAFHHTEPGINTPGDKLELARTAYEQENDPRRKRVNAAMLAGALFNRATDIFTIIVELGEKGVHISRQNELMKQCAQCFKEALELGKHVKHYSGEEGIDELWGEPFKAFTMPMEQFYESRYIKIAQTMRDIERISGEMTRVFGPIPQFKGVAPVIEEMAKAAMLEAETTRSDWAIFEIWPRFVASCEAVENFKPNVGIDAGDATKRLVMDGKHLLVEGKDVLTYLAGARVPMPKTTCEYLEKCAYFAEHGHLEFRRDLFSIE